MIMLGLIAMISLGSCKKDWTCTCTDQSGNNTYHTIPSSTLHDANNTCNGFEYHAGAAYTNCSVQ